MNTPFSTFEDGFYWASVRFAKTRFLGAGIAIEIMTRACDNMIFKHQGFRDGVRAFAKLQGDSDE